MLSCLILDRCVQGDDAHQSDGEADESKLPLQLAIVGKPNVGKSTLLNALLQEERVLVGPEAGLTRDAVRVQFEYQDRTVYLVGFRSSSSDYNYVCYAFLVSIPPVIYSFAIFCFRLTPRGGWRERRETKGHRR